MRQIYIVNATQVVVSTAHPEGIYSTLDGFPKTFDSRSYGATTENPDGNPERAYEVAEAAFHRQWSEFLLSTNRAMWTVTFGRADGRQISQASKGAFPDMTPTPEEIEQMLTPAEEA